MAALHVVCEMSRPLRAKIRVQRLLYMKAMHQIDRCTDLLRYYRDVAAAAEAC